MREIKWYKLLITGIVIIISILIYLFANLPNEIQEVTEVVVIDLSPKYDSSTEDLVTIEPMIELEVPRFTAKEIELLKQIVWAESGNQSYEGQLAVANVIINRIESDYFPNTMEDVVYQGGGRQFNGVWRDSFGFYDATTERAVQEALERPIFQPNVVYFANVEHSTDVGFIESVILKHKVSEIGSHTFAKDVRKGY